MAEHDDRARVTDTANIERDVPAGNALLTADPKAKARLSEGTERVNAYTAANNKDVLPEHQARLDAYPYLGYFTS